MSERTKDELADALKMLCENMDPCGKCTTCEAAARLRSIPEGQRIGYGSLSDFRRAAAVTGEFGDPTVPADLEPLWHDSIPVFLQCGEDKSDEG